MPAAPAGSASRYGRGTEHALSGQRQSLPSLLMAPRDLTKVLNERYPGAAGTRQYLDQLRALSTAAERPSQRPN